MQPLLSEISFVTITDLLPKKAIKTPHELDFPCEKNIYPFNSSFYFCSISLVEWVSWAKRTPLGVSFDLKHSNNLIRFLVGLSPLTLFDINLKLIAGITGII